MAKAMTSREGQKMPKAKTETIEIYGWSAAKLLERDAQQEFRVTDESVHERPDDYIDYIDGVAVRDGDRVLVKGQAPIETVKRSKAVKKLAKAVKKLAKAVKEL